MDFYFFSDARDKWWNSRLPTIEDGDFRRIALRRYRIAGEPFMPALPLRLRPDRYDAVIKNLNGRLMLPSLYGAARLRRVPFVLWTGMWFHPETAFHRLSRPVTEALYRDVPAIVVYGEHVKRVLLEVPGVAGEKIFVAGQAVDASRFTGVQPAGNGRRWCCSSASSRSARASTTCWLRLTRVTEPDGRAPAHRQRLAGGADPRGGSTAARASTIVGHVPQDELPAELGRATCLVLPSVTTRETTSPGGSSSTRRCTPGSRSSPPTPSAPRSAGLVRDGENGYVVPERDPSASATRSSACSSDRDAAARMGRQARVDAAEFNYDRMADAFEDAVEYAVRHGWT